jgi:hypothetical protein
VLGPKRYDSGDHMSAKNTNRDRPFGQIDDQRFGGTHSAVLGLTPRPADPHKKLMTVVKETEH